MFDYAKHLKGNYWIVNQILTKSLHTSDDESMTYTMRLVDKLEQVTHQVGQQVWSKS